MRRAASSAVPGVFCTDDDEATGSARGPARRREVLGRHLCLPAFPPECT